MKLKFSVWTWLFLIISGLMACGMLVFKKPMIACLGYVFVFLVYDLKNEAEGSIFRTSIFVIFAAMGVLIGGGEIVLEFIEMFYGSGAAL